MLGGRGPEQIAVEPRSGLEQVGQRQLRPQAELEGDIAELDVEIDQAGFALVPGLALGEPDRELADERGRADPADALDHADHLAVADHGCRWPCAQAPRGLAPSDVSRSSMLSGSGTTSWAPARTSERTSASGGS